MGNTATVKKAQRKSIQQQGRNEPQYCEHLVGECPFLMSSSGRSAAFYKPRKATDQKIRLGLTLRANKMSTCAASETWITRTKVQNGFEKLRRKTLFRYCMFK